ncbi:MAG: hypothetical protein ABIK96_08140 [bacterium]
MQRFRALALLALLLLPAVGCAPGATSYVRDDVDFSYIRRVAVFPFQNLAQDVHAGSRTYSIFLAELLEQDGLVAVEPGEVLSAVRELRLNTGGPLDQQQVVDLGRALRADAIFFGTIEDYGLDSTERDRVYMITASFSLAETETGSNIWSSQVHRTGSSFLRKLFGGGSVSMYHVTRAAVRDALESLF